MKEHLFSINAPVLESFPLNSYEDFVQACDALGFPLVLKSNRGHVEYILNQAEDMQLHQDAANGKFFAQRHARVLRKFAVSVGIFDGQCYFYPITECFTPSDNNNSSTIFPGKRNFCLTPAQLSSIVENEIILIAEKVVRSFETDGFFSLILHVLDGNNMVVDKVYPR